MDWREPLTSRRGLLMRSGATGAAALMAFLFAGQLLAGMLIDRAGLLGVAVREISLGRITGAVLLLAGALLVRLT